MPRDPVGGIVRNLITIRRLENGLVAEAGGLVDSLFGELVARLVRLDPTELPPGQQQAALGELMGEWDEVVGGSFTDLHSRLRERLVEVGEQQVGWAEDYLENAVLGGVAVDIASGAIGRRMLGSIVDTNPFEGATLSEWASRQEANTLFNLRRQLQLGLAQNETVGDLVRRVRGRAVRPGQYIGGVMGTTTRQAEALVRTAVNEVVSTAHFATYEANKDVAPTYEYVATLDSRTTFICMALDGQEWAYEDPNGKRPPQHWGCRSAIVPVVDWEALGLEPPPEGTRASADGQVKSSTTYEDWLRDQSRATQDEILGPSRAELFRDGKVGLRDLVRNDNSIVTVEELRRQATGPLPPRPTGLRGASLDEARRARSALYRGLETRESVSGATILAPGQGQKALGGSLNSVARRTPEPKLGLPLARDLNDSINGEMTLALTMEKRLVDAGVEKARAHNMVVGLRQASWALEEVDDLAERELLEEAATAAAQTKYVETWAATSADSDPKMLALQLAVREELDLPPTSILHLTERMDLGHGQVDSSWEAARSLFSRHETALRDLVRAQLDETAGWAQEQGLESVTLFRGMKFRRGEVPDWVPADVEVRQVDLQPLSSFTATPKTARKFAGGSESVILVVREEAERIYSTGRTGLGTLHEAEYVLTGGQAEALVIPMRRVRELWEEGLVEAGDVEAAVRYFIGQQDL